MHARTRHEPDVRIGILPLFETKDIHPEICLWRVVLHLAGHHAGAAAGATIKIDHHCIPSHGGHPFATCRPAP